MSPPQRIGFKTLQDWFEFLRDQENLNENQRTDIVRLRWSVYAAIEKTRGRPLLVYFADIENRRKAPLSAIDLNDIEGFTDLVNQCERSPSVDVLLHSGGGSAEMTERVVKILRGKFEEVHFLIPHSAYSAATMLALSGDSITLHPSATLGPIDPQISIGHEEDYVPAASITHGFEKAVSAIETRGPAVLSAYLPLIQRYSLHLLEQCKDATNLSQNLVSLWLGKYMFKGNPNSKAVIEKAVEYFANYKKHLTHARPIGWDEVKDMDLKIHLAEGKLAALLRDAYIMLKGFFSMSPYAKLYENSSNLSYGHSIPIPLPPLPPPEIIEQMQRALQEQSPRK